MKVRTAAATQEGEANELPPVVPVDFKLLEGEKSPPRTALTAEPQRLTTEGQGTAGVVYGCTSHGDLHFIRVPTLMAKPIPEAPPNEMEAPSYWRASNHVRGPSLTATRVKTPRWAGLGSVADPRRFVADFRFGANSGLKSDVTPSLRRARTGHRHHFCRYLQVGVVMHGDGTRMSATRLGLRQLQTASLP